MRPDETLERAAKHMRDRAATYDTPHGERSMQKTVTMFNMLSGGDMNTEEGWMFMAILKMVRSQQGDFRADNYEDLAAYAALAAEEAAFSRRLKGPVEVTPEEDDAWDQVANNSR